MGECPKVQSPLGHDQLVCFTPTEESSSELSQEFKLIYQDFWLQRGQHAGPSSTCGCHLSLLAEAEAEAFAACSDKLNVICIQAMSRGTFYKLCPEGKKVPWDFTGLSGLFMYFQKSMFDTPEMMNLTCIGKYLVMLSFSVLSLLLFYSKRPLTSSAALFPLSLILLPQNNITYPSSLALRGDDL